MSQYGAYGYALHGKDYRFILAHYYQGHGARDDRSEADRARAARDRARPRSAAPRKAGGQASCIPARRTRSGAKRRFADARSTRPARRSARFAAPLTVTGPGPLRLAGHGHYRGSLEFRPDGAGGVQTVNALALEDYVRGVISGEMPASWSPQALKAQAVAARTYAITTDVGGNGFDLYRGHPLADVRRRGGGDAVDRRGGRRDPRPGRDLHGEPVVDLLLLQLRRLHREHRERVAGLDPRAMAEGRAGPVRRRRRQSLPPLGLELSLAGAAAKLGVSSRAALVGIRVTQARRLAADRDRGGGRDEGHDDRHGPSCSTSSGCSPRTPRSRRSRASPARRRSRANRRPPALPGGAIRLAGCAALVPLVHDLIAGARRRPCTAAVFPRARARDVRDPGGSRRAGARVQHGALMPAGAYAAQLPGPGHLPDRLSAGSTGPRRARSR